jgi:Transposase IS116/IS110/IS902 family
VLCPPKQPACSPNRGDRIGLVLKRDSRPNPFGLRAWPTHPGPEQLDEVDAKLTAWHRADECSQRLAKIPSVGPISAVLLRMKAPDPTQFRSGRQFEAWIGLAPKDHSTAG